MLIQRGVGTHLTMSKIQELRCVGQCGEGPWKKLVELQTKSSFSKAFFDSHKKDYPHMENLKSAVVLGKSTHMLACM